ncbi:MAG TPA: Tim44/TimA family putative adaptor protein [Rhizomicrobium sp.]|jgi:predicted lipid-binding transport protein (Tim44 family)|nr:Tim44/TimA family putative adaptor protein [Rhizomicrobium sp.]
MADSQLLGILLLAMVAGIILFRLYTVLGRRTGHEREPQDRLRRIEAGAPQAAASDKLLALPDRTAAASDERGEQDVVAQALSKIKLADRNFDAAHFLEGAREAYREIVTAFAERNRDALRPLLNDEVYAAFDTEMRTHEERRETVNYALVGFSDVRIVHAELKGGVAEVTVRFATQFVSSTTDPSGAVVEGDSKAVRDVVDVWTFDRDTKSSDPNWTLVATTSLG